MSLHPPAKMKMQSVTNDDDANESSTESGVTAKVRAEHPVALIAP